MIRLCTDTDFDSIWSTINDGARAYKGVIPADRWAEPYMSPEALRHEIQEGVTFWGWETAGVLTGVMGMQNVRDVTLIRHAYVLSRNQKQGVGTHLLSHLRGLTTMPMLIGTWADATWAIQFYQRHGFELVDATTKQRLLQTYWSVPQRQIATSVVLADGRWRSSR